MPSMQRDYVRLAVGILVIVTHVAAFFGIVIWQSGYIPSGIERLDLALVLVPVSASYFMAVARSAVQHREDLSGGEPVNVNYVVIALLITLSFCAGLLVFVFGYPNIGGPTIVELRRWLLVLEI